MKLKVEKCTHIINDMILYLHKLGATHYQVDISPKEGKIDFSVKADIQNLSDETLNQLTTAMSQHRQREMEENYWAISYDTASPCEPTLLGMMLDDTTVSYENQVLTISGSR